ncbi:hypothetical protein EJV47_09930 [Hymenobacter gummosus]|uniref:Uncharacterized protein n=1 Tax=Hymenobacter gummosus TaxID=1776032 RepID=A0A3S0IPV2_9BACT|nr:hypothetical protein [Hymenobacter gummosus]RTQ50922.1 hypothetical protein EJV47_09930 [Hymenobacter gummosus]
MEDGVLRFRNRRALSNYLVRASKNERAADQWESAHQFTSMERAYTTAMQADEQLQAGIISSLTPAQQTALAGQPEPHSAAYRQYEAAGTILNVREPDGSHSTWMNTFNPAVARAINSDGIVAIGDSLYRYAADRFYLLKTGDLRRKNELLNPRASADLEIKSARNEQLEQLGAIRSNPQNDQPEPLITYLLKPATGSGHNVSKGLWPAFYSNDSRRVYMSVYFYSDLPSFGSNNNLVNYYHDVLCQRKNTWGNWVAADCAGRIHYFNSSLNYFYTLIDLNTNQTTVNSYTLTDNFHENDVSYCSNARRAEYPDLNGTFTAPFGYGFADQYEITQGFWEVGVRGGNGLYLSITK